MPVFSSPQFDAGVANFKSLFGDPYLYTAGQFYISTYIYTGMISGVRYNLENRLITPLVLNFNVDRTYNGARVTNGTKLDFLIVLLNSFLQFYSINRMKTEDLYKFLFVTFNDTNGAPCASPEVLTAIVASIRNVFPVGEPDGTETPRIRSAFSLVWNNTNTGVTPWLSLTANSKFYKAAYAFEKDKCRAVCEALARKYLNAKGVTRLPAAAKLSAGVVANAQFIPAGPSTAPPPAETPQTVVYGSPTELAKAVATVQSAIDSGGVVKCGVLSGVRQDNAIITDPEHYVMLFAYGTAGGANALLFWDPDAQATNIASQPTWGTGFGCMFVTADRFSSAIDAADLPAVDQNGDHINEPRRHRYQMFYLLTLPW